MVNANAPNQYVDVDLRILATSDVHGHLSGYDDIRERPTPRHGLARLAGVIEKARHTAPGMVLLLDNGDTLQGTPLAETARQIACGPKHPFIAVMTRLNYDAMGLGNHDFDYGIDYLEAFCHAVPCPVLATNIEGINRKAIAPHTILERQIPLPTGDTYRIKIGLLAVLPMQTAQWLEHELQGRVHFRDPLSVARNTATALRTDGADIVIALAHSGLGDLKDTDDGMGNFVRALAATAPINAIVGGHTHRRVPGDDIDGYDDVDAKAGLVGSIPCVMPGYGAEALGQIDLRLRRRKNTAWQTIHAHTSLRDAAGEPADPEILNALEPTQQLTRNRLRRHIGHLPIPMNSYFAQILPSAVHAVIGTAMREALEHIELPTGWRHLPRLAAMSIGMTGGCAGPTHYIDIPSGPMAHRALEALCPHQDGITAFHITGAELRDWLERAAAAFTWLDGPKADQPLIDVNMPAYHFDVIHGVKVRFDPRQPARYSADGTPRARDAGRVAVLEHDGAPIADHQEFVMALNNHRAAGGGRYPVPKRTFSTLRPRLKLRDILTDYLSNATAKFITPVDWRLLPYLGRKALFYTSPLALPHLDMLSPYRPENLGVSKKGFLKLRLSL